MAYTKIWDVNSRIDRAVNYAKDEKKTAANIERVFAYATDTEKTEKLLFVSALNCTSETATGEMFITKRRWNKKGAY